MDTLVLGDQARGHYESDDDAEDTYLGAAMDMDVLEMLNKRPSLLRPKSSTAGSHFTSGSAAFTAPSAAAAPLQSAQYAPITKARAPSIHSKHPAARKRPGTSSGTSSRMAPGTRSGGARPATAGGTGVTGGVSELHRLAAIVAQHEAKMAAQALRIKGQLETIKQLQAAVSQSNETDMLRAGTGGPIAPNSTHGINAWLNTTAHNLARSDTISLTEGPQAVRPSTALTSVAGVGRDAMASCHQLVAPTSQREVQLLQALQEVHAKLKEAKRAETEAKQRASTLVELTRHSSREKGGLSKELESARKAAADTDAERGLLKRRVENLQKFLHQEKSARQEAEARLAASEQRAAVLGTQVEASKTQLLQLQGLVEAASAAQLGFEAAIQKANNKICRVQARQKRGALQLAAAQQEVAALQLEKQVLAQQVAGLQRVLEDVYVTRIGSEQMHLLQQQLAEQQAALLQQQQAAAEAAAAAAAAQQAHQTEIADEVEESATDGSPLAFKAFERALQSLGMQRTGKGTGAGSQLGGASEAGAAGVKMRSAQQHAFAATLAAASAADASAATSAAASPPQHASNVAARKPAAAAVGIHLAPQGRSTDPSAHGSPHAGIRVRRRRVKRTVLAAVTAGQVKCAYASLKQKGSVLKPLDAQMLAQAEAAAKRTQAEAAGKVEDAQEGLNSQVNDSLACSSSSSSDRGHSSSESDSDSRMASKAPERQPTTSAASHAEKHQPAVPGTCQQQQAQPSRAPQIATAFEAKCSGTKPQQQLLSLPAASAAPKPSVLEVMAVSDALKVAAAQRRAGSQGTCHGSTLRQLIAQDIAPSPVASSAASDSHSLEDPKVLLEARIPSAAGTRTAHQRLSFDPQRHGGDVDVSPSTSASGVLDPGESDEAMPAAFQAVMRQLGAAARTGSAGHGRQQNATSDRVPLLSSRPKVVFSSGESSSRSGVIYAAARSAGSGLAASSSWSPSEDVGAAGQQSGLTTGQLETFLRRSAAASASSRGSSPRSAAHPIIAYERGADQGRSHSDGDLDAAETAGQAQHSSDEGGSSMLLGKAVHAAAIGMLGRVARRTTASSASMDMWIRAGEGGPAGGAGTSGAMAAASMAAGPRHAAGMLHEDASTSDGEAGGALGGSKHVWLRPGSAGSLRGRGSGAGPVRAWLGAAVKARSDALGSDDEDVESDAAERGLQETGASGRGASHRRSQQRGSSGGGASTSQAAIAAFAVNSTALLAQAKALASGLGAAWGKAPVRSSQVAPAQLTASIKQASVQRSILASPPANNAGGALGAAVGGSTRPAWGTPAASTGRTGTLTMSSGLGSARKGQGGTPARPGTAGSSRQAGGESSALKARYRQLKHDS